MFIQFPEVHVPVQGLDEVEVPQMVTIRQRYDASKVEDVEGALRDQLEALPDHDSYEGKRIAITVGSRGIPYLPEMVRMIGEVLKSWGASPFIVPAMGSHGGATAEGQVEMIEADKLHQAGFRGQGMTVAVIDGGFLNADAIPLLQNVKIEGTRNFVHPGWDVYAELDHGMSVLSCMAANHPYTLVGTAPEASYWLFCSEDPDCECLAEEDYWAQAVEYADSVGVDVVNTSLGYYAFDDRSKDYRYRDLDGRTSLMTRSASMAADKGMIVVCSAGNSGDKQWKKITPPADADHVLTVGAVDARGMNTTFSSVGYTADGRVKPDVMARGGHTALIRPNGRVSAANGTSFSAPVLCGGVACLWQACPQLTAKEVMELVRRSGDRFECPDNIFGYGIPSLWKAYLNANR